MKQPCVYIMASKRHGTLYTGVTANLPKRGFRAPRRADGGIPGQVWLQDVGLV